MKVIQSYFQVVNLNESLKHMIFKLTLMKYKSKDLDVILFKNNELKKL